MSAVVERLEPEDLFEWFVDYREALGLEVIPLGDDVASRVAKSLKNCRVLCLLSDRDIEGTGVEVEFFGERTTLPAGPATLAFRIGAPILPAAIYFRGEGVHTEVRAPLVVERNLTAPSNLTVEIVGVNAETGTHLDVVADWDHVPAVDETAPAEFLVFRRRDDGNQPLPSSVGSESSSLSIEKKFQFGERTYCVWVEALLSIDQRSPASEEVCIETPPHPDGVQTVPLSLIHI